jgi:16S rRNA (guanine527-N7)-methyltransferase
VAADPVQGLVPEGALTGDIGSGAGLPGLVWAIARPDLRIVLVEPLLRRSTFLEEAVQSLGLSDRVLVWRGRAEDAPSTLPPMDVVTARAVAPLSRLLGWTIPLLRPGGHLVALKGGSAETEVTEAATEIRDWDLHDVQVRHVGEGQVDPPTTVIVGRRGTAH